MDMDAKQQREKTLQRKTMRLMLLHFEHSHDLSLKSAFEKLKNLGMQRMEKIEEPRPALE